MEKRKGTRESGSKRRVDRNDRGHATYNDKLRKKTTTQGSREIKGVNETSTGG